MSGKTNNPISLGQIEADLFMAKAAIEKAESMSSKSGKFYRHSLDDLITYAQSLNIGITVPKWVNKEKYTITSWEAEGRYDLHFVVRIDTLKKAFREISQWKKDVRL